jgi:hypothetical protein
LLPLWPKQTALDFIIELVVASAIGPETENSSSSSQTGIMFFVFSSDFVLNEVCL